MNLEKLNKYCPESVMAELPSVIKQFQITTPLRLAHFLAQCAHESGGFKLVEENLNYSASRLLQVFPKYFNTATSQTAAHHPEKIADIVYANRMGNGRASSGEGFAFRGRGYIQLTGKNGYSRFSCFIGEDVVANPDLVASKYPLASAAFFFTDNQLWKWCDVGFSDSAVLGVTKRVNGGTNGLDERIKLFKQFYAALK
jgi:putative chitinase